MRVPIPSTLAAVSALVVAPSVAWASLDFNSFPVFASFGLGLLTSAAAFTGLRIKNRPSNLNGTGYVDVQNRLEALDVHSIVSVTDENARIVDVNQRFIDTFGYELDELVGNETSLIYPESERQQFSKIRSKLTSGESWTGELKLQAKCGRPIWTQTTIFPLFSDDGRHVSSISVRTDITAIKQAQSEQDMRSTLQMLRDEVYVFDAETLRYSYMNKAAMVRAGWTEAEYRGKTPEDAIEGYDRQEFFERAKPLVAGEKQQLTYVIEVDGSSLEINLQHVTTKEGRRQFVAFANDISERLAHEQAKVDFISTVSHELRSPLTSIKGGLGLVLSGATGELSDKSRSLLEIAHRNSDRLVLIINDILDLEKIASGNKQLDITLVDLATLVKDAAAANDAFCAHYNIKIRLVETDQPCLVECDANQVFQILNNLLSNAAKFSNPGDEVVVSLATDGPDTLISVRDYGVGIPMEAQATIFDRFTQVAGQDRKAKGGTGLGLNIVKVIAEHHGGTVTFESAQGAGTTFIVRLPTQASVDSAAIRKADALDAAQ
ncbi:PAS domain-containing sensor histidine kinase [Litoreibacter halocynthiae]|uniref:PAS domain-containing sensor histidine kinase n=1 Tax=Litoreibacter halocynthiae TaxID=1242689 RepID=UPI002490D271|nr:PAS domain-containing sensor histidine kinase [Litoreibacter halocynthiae]